MKRSISNIAWEAEADVQIYELLSDLGYDAIEIAPTRWFPQKPYDCLLEAEEMAKMLQAEYGLGISSMQSIWFQQTGSIFGSKTELSELLEYTKKAIVFARAISCGNLVFGCPRNRTKPDGADEGIALEFFHACAEYAHVNGTCFSLEPNPPIYHTNFINTTEQAFECVRQVAHKGFKVNVDMGTMIFYDEPVSMIEKNLELVNHVHISEPGLAAPVHDALLRNMIDMLRINGYDGCISIEMGKSCGLEEVIKTVKKIQNLF